MLTFLNSYILPALALAALPILIHLLTRHKIKEQQFSDIKFLEEIHRKRMKRMRLRQWLILLLRTLIILFIVAAFARPTIRGINFGGVGSHEKTAVAILLDDSYSTGAVRGGTDVFTFEKAAANKILSLLEEGDVAAVGIFDENVRWLNPKPSRFFKNLAAMLDTVSISDFGTDVPNAIAEGQKMLASYSAPNKEIYVLTDGTAKGWHTQSTFDTTSQISIYVLPIPPDRLDNRTIVAAEFPPQLLETGNSFDIGAVIKNNGKAVKGVVASLVLDGKKSSQTILDIPAGAQITANLSGMPSSGGFHWGYTEISEDNLHADNRRYITFRIPKSVKVLIVGNAEQRKFFRLALSPEGETSFFTIREITSAQLGAQIFTDYDVVLLIDPASPSDAVISRLRTFVSSGGGMMLVPGENSAKNLSSFRKMLKNFGAIDVSSVIGDTSQTAQLGWGKANIEHPVLDVFRETSLPPVVVKKIVQFSIGEGQVFLRFGNDMPALADVPLGDGRIIVSGFSTDMRWGNVPISGFFVPMLHRVCQYLASDVAYFDVGYPVGSDISRTIEDFTGSGKLYIHFPGGSGIFAAPRFVGGKPAIFIHNLQRAGIYTITADAETLDMFAANISPAEGDITPLDSKTRKNISVKWLDPEKDIAAQILSARYGVELWRTMLILALLLMAAEMIIETRWKKKD